MDTQAKLTVLAQVASALNARGIVWAVGASTLLFIQGVVDDFNDIDLLIAKEDVDAVRDTFLSLGADALPSLATSSVYASAWFGEFQLHSVEFDVISDFTIRRKDGTYHYPFDQSRIAHWVDVQGTLVPLCSLADWVVLYWLMPARNKRATLLMQHLREHPTQESRAYLHQWLTSRLPGEVREKVLTLYHVLNSAGR